MTRQKVLDTMTRPYEVLGEIIHACGSYKDQQPETRPHDRILFIRFVANAAIARYRDPSSCRDTRNPDLVRRVVGEMKMVRLNLDPGCS